MKKQNMFFLTVLLAFCSMLSFAQIPRTLSYQGVLTDSLGNPKPDGTYSLTFRLYDAESSGSVLWTEVKTLDVKRGLFTTLLGDQVIFGTTVKFDKPYWLSIQVASQPELSPRIPLSAVGYSLNSHRADTAQYALSAPIQMIVDSARIASSVPDNSITGQKISNSQVVRSINNKKDNITLSAQGGATITSSGDTIVINAGSGYGDSSGVFGIQNTNNTLDITNPNGPTVTVNVKDNIYLRKQGPDTIISTTGPGLKSVTFGSSTESLTGLDVSCLNNSSGNAIAGTFTAGIGGTGTHYGISGQAYNNTSTSAIGTHGYGNNSSSGTAIGGSFNGYSSGTGKSYGIAGNGEGTSTGEVYGGYFQGHSTGTGFTYGTYHHAIGTSPNNVCGVYSEAENSSSGPAIGGYFSVKTSGSGLHIGILATSNNVPNSYAGYFDGRGYFSGNVGIGKTIPSYPLDVVGTVKADSFSGDGSLLTNIHASDPSWSGGGTPSAPIWRTGNVGIGTSTPGAGLVVSGSGLWSSALGIENTTADIEWRLATANDSSFHFVKLTGSTITPLTLAANGNVGIGVSPPTKKLDVNGPTHIKDTIAVGSPTQNGTFQLYRNGSSFPVVWMENFSTHGGRIVALDEIGVITGQLRPSSSGTGGTLELYRNTTGGLGFYATGNVDGTQQGYMSVSSASRSAVFNMGASGNSSVQLPDNSISATEILDEPGIAHNLSANSVNITGNSLMVDIDTVSITIPAPGYIYVHARAMAYLSGTINGNHVLAQIDTTEGGSWISGKHTEIGVDIASTGTSMLDLSVQQVFFKQAGTYTFRLEAMPYYVSSGGNENIYYPVITAIYFPTSYGAVTTVVSGSDAAGFNASPVSVSTSTPPEIPSAVTNAYQVDLRELELKATKARLAAEEAERKLMEAKMERQNNSSTDNNK